MYNGKFLIINIIIPIIILYIIWHIVKKKRKKECIWIPIFFVFLLSYFAEINLEHFKIREGDCIPNAKGQYPKPRIPGVPRSGHATHHTGDKSKSHTKTGGEILPGSHLSPDKKLNEKKKTKPVEPTLTPTEKVKKQFIDLKKNDPVHFNNLENLFNDILNGYGGDKQKFVKEMTKSLKEAVTGDSAIALKDDQCTYNEQYKECHPYNSCTLKKIPKTRSDCFYDKKTEQCEPKEYCESNFWDRAFTSNRCALNKDSIKNAKPQCVVKSEIIKNSEIKYCPQYITATDDSLKNALASINQKYKDLSLMQDLVEGDLQKDFATKIKTLKYNAMDLQVLSDIITKSKTKEIKTICPHIPLWKKVLTGTLNVLKIGGEAMIHHPSICGDVANMLLPGSGTFVSKGLGFLGKIF